MAVGTLPSAIRARSRCARSYLADLGDDHLRDLVAVPRPPGTPRRGAVSQVMKAGWVTTAICPAKFLQ